jgi:hypothetical protein
MHFSIKLQVCLAYFLFYSFLGGGVHGKKLWVGKSIFQLDELTLSMFKNNSCKSNVIPKYI